MTTTEPTAARKEDDRLLVGLVLAFFVMIVGFHLASAAAGYPQYRDIHLGTALEYAKGRIDLLRPILVGFNATNTPTPQELPLWQAAAGAVFKICGRWLGWANVVSLVLFAAGFWPFFQLAAQYLGRRGALWALLFLLFQPIVFLYAGMAATDGFVLVCTLWFLYCAENLVRAGSVKWFVLASIFASLTAVSKLPYFMAAGLAVFLLTVFQWRLDLRRLFWLGGAGLIGLVVFAVWSRYTGYVYRQAIFPEVNLQLTKDSGMWFWFVGDWHFRLNPFNWGKGGWAALNSLFGSFALAGMVAWALFFSRNRLGQSLFLGAFVTTLIFSHLVLIHRHYFLMYSPAVAILCAGALTKFEELIGSDPSRRTGLTIAVGLVAFLSTIQGLMGIKAVLGYDPYIGKMTQLLREQTSPQDKLLIQGGGWGGELLFLSDRAGLSMQDTHILESSQNVEKLKSLGFTKLVMINESPLLTALKKVDPGNTKIERETYQLAITETPKTWPTIFQNDDLLIKSVP